MSDQPRPATSSTGVCDDEPNNVRFSVTPEGRGLGMCTLHCVWTSSPTVC